jgi:hypothetical protein
MTGRLQKDVILRLSRREGCKPIATILQACRKPSCTGCGDVCPVKAALWKATNLSVVKKLFRAKKNVSILHARITRDCWELRRGHLHEASLGAVEKFLRRSLDTLRQPATVAVGFVDAWYNHDHWEIGAELLIAGPSRSDLFNRFRGASCQIDRVPDSATAALDLLGSARRAKLMYLLADATVPGSKRRGEYYAWLANLPFGSRVFRYGCDRYFNKLKKKNRPIGKSATHTHVGLNAGCMDTTR